MEKQEKQQQQQQQSIIRDRDLTQDEIDVLNEIKAKSNDIGELVKKIELANLPGNVAPEVRWVAIAKTHLQEGFMALTRAITKPESF